MTSTPTKRLRLLAAAALLVTAVLVLAVRLRTSASEPMPEVVFTVEEGAAAWLPGVGLTTDAGSGALRLDTASYSPRSISWEWAGTGAWFTVRFADGNTIHYSLPGSVQPQTTNVTFLSPAGLPRVRVPRVVVLDEGAATVDLRHDYRRFFGAGSVEAQDVLLVYDTESPLRVDSLHVIEHVAVDPAAEAVGTYLQGEQVSLTWQLPQGNRAQPYLPAGTPIVAELRLRMFSAQAGKGEVSVSFPEGLEVTRLDARAAPTTDGVLLDFPLASGYQEQTWYFTVRAAAAGTIVARLTGASPEPLEVVTHYAALDPASLGTALKVTSHGVYPLGSGSDDGTLRTQLRNDLRLREGLNSSLQRLFGGRESADAPAGVVRAVLYNSSAQDLVLHVRYQVLDAQGAEITAFRGEHLQQASDSESALPEAVLLLPAGRSVDWRAPLYADVYNVSPGTYAGRFEARLFGSRLPLWSSDEELRVHKDDQLQLLVTLVGLLLAATSVALFALKQRPWLAGMRTSQLILLALITAVKFAVIDVPWTVLGDAIRAFLGPLGPFVQLGTGIFSDILQALFLTALIVLVPKPGVAVISGLVRVILGAVAFGSFNPVSISLTLSYALLADLLLYAFGFTSGRLPLGSRRAALVLIVIFAVQHVYSTYTFYYTWMYMYRLFYPDWYIGLNALISVVYSAVGAVLGLLLGARLKKVID